MARDGEAKGISRRTLLIGGGAGLGLFVGWALWPRTYAPNLRAAPGEILLNAFLKLGLDGRVIVAVPQAELGQGVTTALPQILADELGADWRTVAVEPAPIGPLYANRLLADEAATASSFPPGLDGWAAGRYAMREALILTAGSSSVRAFEAPLREAGAAARALLSRAAARRWGANWEELETRQGFVWRGADRIAFAELAEAAADETLPEHLPVRGGSDHRLVGRALPRLDLPAKIDGSALFAADVRLPDMVFAAVRGAPVGSRRRRLDRARAERVAGALAVIENPAWVAVAARTSWAAARALDALRPVWEIPKGPSDASIVAGLRSALAEGEAARVYDEGDGEVPAGASAVTATYRVGLAPGAAIEPLTATARFTADGLEIWAAAQAPSLARAAAARAAGLGEEQVTFYPMLGGGGYGRRLETEAIEQAAAIARALERPVQLTWPRIQDIQRDRFRPAAMARMTAWVGRGGIARWQARIAVADVDADLARRLHVARSFFRPGAGPVAGAVPPYAIPSVSIDHVAVEPGVPIGAWRSGAHSYSVFFTECFVDELARASGLEPLSFRMAMIGANPRLARCLATATAIGGWDGGALGSSMGIAATSAFGSHIATLVEIEVARDRRVRVLRAVCAVDCGRIVNPELVRQQIEGGFIHGLSAATGDPVEIADGVPKARTMGAWRLPALRDSPEISVELIESEDAPGGVTELAVPVAAPAIANAVFALTGRRLRALPLELGRR